MNKSQEKSPNSTKTTGGRVRRLILPYIPSIFATCFCWTAAIRGGRQSRRKLSKYNRRTRSFGGQRGTCDFLDDPSGKIAEELLMLTRLRLPAFEGREPSGSQSQRIRKFELNRIKSNSLENSYLIGDPAAGDAADLSKVTPKIQPRHCRGPNAGQMWLNFANFQSKDPDHAAVVKRRREVACALDNFKN